MWESHNTVLLDRRLSTQGSGAANVALCTSMTLRGGPLNSAQQGVADVSRIHQRDRADPKLSMSRF